VGGGLNVGTGIILNNVTVGYLPSPLDYYESRVCDSKALPGASVLLWSRDLTDPRQAPDLRDRTMDLIGWTEKKHKVRVNGKWVEKSVWD
jgi:hypothetical protein